MLNLHHYLPRKLPSPIDQLTELSLDLRWSSSHVSDALWETIDADLWKVTHNPTLVLETVSQQRLEELTQNTNFLELLTENTHLRDERLGRKNWFQEIKESHSLGMVAYFSMEFGLSEALPIYSGGLGILAGDVLKTASDLGIPVIGIGLLYQQGYFRQAFGAQGEQITYFPYNDPAMLPVVPLRDSEGEWVRIEVQLPGRCVYLRCWEAKVGQTHLLLLDSNDPVNGPADRGIAGELYGGGNERRLQQEIVLGIGGWRMLEAVGLKPQVCHLNEGHAALATLQRAAHCMREYRLDFATAFTCTRAGNLFTTHTPVPAAFDCFDPQMVRRYLQPYAEEWHVDVEQLLDLGRINPGARDEPFNLANLALHASSACNGVSQLHGAVSRKLFAPLFPRWPIHEIPVGHITNGVHTPSWDSKEADTLWHQAGQESPWIGDLKGIADGIRKLDDATLWEFRVRQRQVLMDSVREYLARQCAKQGHSQADIVRCTYLLDPNALTLGFARRFTAYKRPNLLLQQPERLKRLLGDTRRPVQLFLAGKAHPKDKIGQAMIREWNQFISQSGLPEGRVVFLEDYDMAIAATLAQGVAVWINTPRRPWEASGTSGMKVLVNGGLNLSELDGWWAEAYAPEVGWALGDGQEHDDDPAWDAKEADDLFTLLEQQIIPEFHQRDAEGIPRHWVGRIRESMTRLTPQYSTNRMLREYVTTYYLPLARRERERAADNARIARDLMAWKQRIDTHWSSVYPGNHFYTTRKGGFSIDAQIFLDGLVPDDVQVELYADPGNPEAQPEVHLLNRGTALPGSINGHHYQGTVQTVRPASHYTLRIRPYHPEAVLPMDDNRITWAG